MSASLLSQDELSCIFKYLEGHDRLPVMLTCKRWCEVALSKAWPPWDHRGLGLLHACYHGHVDYYRKWSRRAGSKRWNPMKVSVELFAGYDNDDFPLMEGICARSTLELYNTMFEEHPQITSAVDRWWESEKGNQVEPQHLGNQQRNSSGGSPMAEEDLESSHQNEEEVGEHQHQQRPEPKKYDCLEDWGRIGCLDESGRDQYSLRQFFWRACCGGNLGLAEALLRDPRVVPTKHDFIWGCCYYQHLDLVKLLIADPRITSEMRLEALGNASARYAREITHFLLSYDPKMNIPALDNEPPLFFCCRNGWEDCIDMILSNFEGDALKSLVAFGDRHTNTTPFIAACSYGHLSCAKLIYSTRLIGSEEVTRALLAVICKWSDNGDSASACMWLTDELEAVPDGWCIVNASCKNGFTPLLKRWLQSYSFAKDFLQEAIRKATKHAFGQNVELLESALGKQ